MWELRRELESRKENLIYTLKNKKDFIELEKQHQMYGAIKELDLVLKLIDQYREKEATIKFNQVLESTETSQSVEAIDSDNEEVESVKTKIRRFRSPIRIRFVRNDA